MDLPNILNNRGPAAAAAAEQQLQQQLAQAIHSDGRPHSNTGSERALSPHVPESAIHTSRNDQLLRTHRISPEAQRSNSPPHSGQPLPMLPAPYMSQNGSINSPLQGRNQNPRQTVVHDQTGSSHPPEVSSAVKAFACSACAKGFARRSDLARHERIHTGVRPHVCDYPGCNKQFIQRSALTVHARVHTGEKPHMCEHCTKPFSDSSSLARHRRIHSGKRPYKCPFADCQKTFTRRTTLTRHQNHHTGTVEQAAAATAAALASRPGGRAQRNRSDGETQSDTGSPHSTPSPAQRPLSLSPSGEVHHMSLLPRQPGDFPYSSGFIPPHMRGDLQHHSSRSSTASTSPSLSAFGSSHHRPSLTSHPVMYGQPPQLPPLEPPCHLDNRAGSSMSGSPHLSSVGWQSPIHPSLGSPSQNYIYPEPPFGTSAPHLYYPNSNLRRPQSTEPDHYEAKPRMMSSEVWTGQM